MHDFFSGVHILQPLI